jgi:hypothetical protein
MTNNHSMTNDPTKQDRDLDLWREQWSSVARPSPDFQRQVQQRIKVQERRFWLGNLLALAAFGGMLTLAFYQLTHPASRLEKGQATGVCVLLFVAVTCRLWIMRGTWRAETQSVRAFMELWQRRVLARIRGLQIAIYLAIGWLVFGAVLAGANWATIRLAFRAHPAAFFAMMVFIVLMLRLIWFGVMWFRRLKVAELNEVTRLLEEIKANE